MDKLQSEGDGFDLTCKALMVVSVLAFTGGLALTIMAVYQPLHYVLYTLGVVGFTAALVVCLRETNLVGHDDRADPDPQDDDPSGPKETRED